jgi:hypothetical protein
MTQLRMSCQLKQRATSWVRAPWTAGWLMASLVGLAGLGSGGCSPVGTDDAALPPDV